MPLTGAESSATPAAPSPLIQQNLREKTAERMAHDNRRLVEGANDAVVMIRNFGHAQPAKRGRVAANIFNAAFHAGPCRSNHVVACVRIALDPVSQDSGVITGRESKR